MSDFWQDRPCLVTGATGLLGGWLVKRLLAEGADVTCLVRTVGYGGEYERSKSFLHTLGVQGSVEDLPLVSQVVLEHQIDVVFHLAAQTQIGVANRNPTTTWNANVGGTMAVLEACRRGKVSAVVVASSDKAYGDRGREPIPETAALRATAPYDVSKAAADMIARSYAASFGLPVAVTRCGNLYGGGDLNWNRLVPGTIRSVLRGQRPLLRSDGSMVRDYLFVDDAVEGYLMLAEGLTADPFEDTRGQAFNFSGGQPCSAMTMMVGILDVMGRDGVQPIIGYAKPVGEIPCQVLDCTKARKVLGWEPRVALLEGLEKTVAWYREALK